MTLQEVLTLKEDQVRQFDCCLKGAYPDKEWARSQYELFKKESTLVKEFMSGRATVLQLPRCHHVDVGICALDHEGSNSDCVWKSRPCPYRYQAAPRQGQFI